MKRKLMTLGGVAVLALGLAGCGGAGGAGSGMGGDEAAAAKTVEDFLTASIEGDGETVCGLALISEGKPMKDDPSYDLCVSTYESMGDDMKEKAEEAGIGDFKVKKITVDGDTATVAGKDIEGMGDLAADSDTTLTLEKIDGKWYINPATAANSVG